MRANTSRTKLLIVVSIVFAAGVVLYFWRAGKDTATSPTATNDTAKHTVPISDSRPDTTQISSNLPDPQPQSRQERLGDFAVLAQERLNNKLTNNEALILDRLYKSTVSKREQLELSLATRDEVNPNEVLLTIPAYYAKGLEIYSAFVDGLSNELGKTRAQELLHELDQSLRADNTEFGQQEQQILVENKGDSIHVVHGGGGLIQLNGEYVLTNTTAVSDLQPQNLLRYEYLKSLFPANVAGSKK